MNIIEALFNETNVVSTREVARTFEMSETDVRAWAEELRVAKIGASFAWARADVEELAEQLDEDENECEESADESEDEDDSDDDELDEEDDDDEDEEDDDDEDAREGALNRP